MREITLGSLFSGSGSFELAGCLNGITPKWNSEIEKFCLQVEKARFPDVKQLGSVTDVKGNEIEPVDIITFGSPCQDLSVAGKQAGIHEGERSSLFFEAIRIIREMREKDSAAGRTDKFIRPRFAVWENVPGAFSSNKGHDFQAVLQAFCEIRGGRHHIVPMPQGGRWKPAGCVVGDGWSVAWRVYDAQYWPGTPQRRKRIYLIADFGSERAGEILFKPESVRGNPAQGGETRQGTAADAERSAGGSDRVECLNPWDAQSIRQFGADGVWPSLQANSNGGQNRSGVCYALDALSSNSMKSSNPHSGFHEETVTKTLNTSPDPTCNQGGNVIVQSAAFMGGQGAKARSIAYCDDGSTPTLKSAPSGGNTVSDVVYAVEGNTVDRESEKNGKGFCEGVSPTLNTQDKHAVTYAIEGNGQRQSHQGDGYAETDTMYTLNTIERHAVCFQCCGDRKDPSVSVSEKAYCLPANPMSDRQQAVCFQQNQRDEVRDMGDASGALSAESGSHQQNYVCYGIDCRNAALDKEKTHTIQAKASGGISLNCTPSVLYRQSGFSGYSEGVGTLRASGGDNGGGKPRASLLNVFDNHSQDSRYTGPVDVSQTVSATFGNGGNNQPFVVEEIDDA